MKKDSTMAANSTAIIAALCMINPLNLPGDWIQFGRFEKKQVFAIPMEKKKLTPLSPQHGRCIQS